MVDAVAEGLEACGGVPTTRGAGQEGGGRRPRWCGGLRAASVL